MPRTHIRLFAAALAALTLYQNSATARPADDAGPPRRQMVLISFDGAGDNGLWERSRAIAARTGARFTYFLSCAHLVDRASAITYQAPGRKPGRSNIGFAPSVEDVATRLGHIWTAHREGHEIANHTCGHFDGKAWTRADWLQEFESFDRVLADAWKNAGIGAREPEGWRDFVANDIRGFRAPYLSQSSALTEALKARGFTYDASLVTRGPQMPTEEGGILRFGLPLIAEGPKGRPIIGMDYNLYVRHSDAIEAPEQADLFEDRAFDAFMAAFEEHYSGDRIPLQFGFHFVAMNGGAYWRAMERLVDSVCLRADVACVTYQEAAAALREDAPPKGDAAGSY